MFRWWLVVFLLVFSGGAVIAQAPKLRALWVDVFHEGIKTPEQVQQLIDRAKRARINTLFIQVRSRGQVYHTSFFEPRAPDTLPWFDGLAEVIRLAHRQDPPIQVHAWINAHPLWVASSDPPWFNHVFYRHPEWLTKNLRGEVVTPVGRAIDFGHPEAADYLLRLYLEVVRRYPVDGVHLDFIRYAGKEWGYNEVSLARFRRAYGWDESRGLPSPSDPEFSEWRRRQVTEFVFRLVHHIKAINPKLMVSAALIAWGDAPKDFKASSAYRECFQDWKAWCEAGLLDLAVPMLYFRETTHSSHFRNWVEFCRAIPSRTPIAAGIGNWLNAHKDTLKQAEYADARLAGVSFFSYASTNPYPGQEAELFNEAFYDALSALSPGAPLSAREEWLREVITFGYQLNSELEPVDGGVGFYVRRDRRQGFVSRDGDSQPSGALVQVDQVRDEGAWAVYRLLPSALEAKDEEVFYVLGASVVWQRGSLVLLRDRQGHQAVVMLPSPPEFPLLPGDLLALRVKKLGNTLMAERYRWLGVVR
jgi:uncharacterized lipoprotein YddW (UPF0748 family)